jgi:hypothetical protein
MESFIGEVIVPMAHRRRWAKFCEIGASVGLGTDRLLTLPDATITIIDPCFDMDLAAKYLREPRVLVCNGLSLDVLPRLNAGYDCILVDGDHNWFTVHEELEVIRKNKLLKPGGVIFLDDVEWPYGRRDMYYQPDVIPATFRHLHARKGILRGKGELTNDGGLNGQFCNAQREGGPRNGVLTAIEDFLRGHRGEYRFFRIRENAGLGAILQRTNFTHDFWFLLSGWRSAAHNMFTWPKRFSRDHFPLAYSFSKSVLRRT